MKLERFAKLGAVVAASATISCSDPVPPPAQTSLFFTLGTSNDPNATGGCSVTGYTAHIGGPPLAVRSPEPGPREIDGQGDASVGCRVAGGGPFSLGGSASIPSAFFTMINGVVSGTTGTATIAVGSGPGTAGQSLTSPAGGCTLRVAPPPLQIAPGSVWALFDCPLVTVPSAPGYTCSAAGEFVFENCEE